MNEIFIVPEADVVHVTKGSTLIADSLNRTWRGDKCPAGSETVARYQMDIMGTWGGPECSPYGSMCYHAYKRQDSTDDILGLRSILIKLFKGLTGQFIDKGW